MQYFLRAVDTAILQSNFTDSSGHGLKITAQNDTLVDGCVVSRNGWQGIWVGGEQGQAPNYRLAIRNSIVDANGQNGIQLGGTVGFEVSNCTVRYQSTVHFAGLAIQGSSDGVVSGGTIQGNAINILASGAGTKNVSVSGVGCDLALYGQATCIAQSTEAVALAGCSCTATAASKCPP